MNTRIEKLKKLLEGQGFTVWIEGEKWLYFEYRYAKQKVSSDFLSEKDIDEDIKITYDTIKDKVLSEIKESLL